MPILSAIGQACSRAFGLLGSTIVTANYLVVAGGGAGAGSNSPGAGGGGGGAGGLLSGTTSLNPTLSYTVTVGGGGAQTSSNTSAASAKGSDSAPAFSWR